MTRSLFVAAVLIAASAAAVAAAQAPAPAVSPSPRPSPSPSPAASSDRPPDIELTAHVTYRELRFDRVGTPRVEFSGTADRETVWHADRENLPTPVQPGVTYHDGGVRLVISSRFRDLLTALDAGASPAAPAPNASPAAGPSPSASASPASTPRPRTSPSPQ
jgi:hypothetical protein